MIVKIEQITEQEYKDILKSEIRNLKNALKSKNNNKQILNDIKLKMDKTKFKF
jgi:hypothetical protein